MFQKIIFFAVIYVVSIFSVFAQSGDISIGSYKSIQSVVLNEERKFWLYLPPNHDPSRSYPVIYMMDGDRSFHYASGILKQLAANGKMPETILVAIPNTDRNRDLSPTYTALDYQGNPKPFLKTTGGGDNFLKFIKTELSPYIEENYTASKFRILIGHSLGGLMVTHALLEDADFFNAFVAIDPSLWWDDRIMNKNLVKKLTKKREGKNVYYMSSANNGDPTENIMLKPQIEFMANLANWDTDTLIFKREYFNDDDHGSVDLISIYNGLQFIFENYRLDFTKALNDPDYLDDHFKNVSNRLGYKFSPDESTINMLGYTNLFAKKEEKALELFLQNTKNYPKSSNSYDSLADAYKALGSREMTIKSLEKAIKLNPNAEGSKVKLKEFLESKSN